MFGFKISFAKMFKTEISSPFEKKEPTEVTIKIYDHIKTDYPLQVERLRLVLRALDLGEIIHEGWGVDYPRPFMPIEVYEVKVVPYVSPIELKFYLKGLEYIGYERLVDYDVEVEGKKISWVEMAKAMGLNVRNKFEIAQKCREALMERLSPEVKAKLKELEEKILSLRE